MGNHSPNRKFGGLRNALEFTGCLDSQKRQGQGFLRLCCPFEKVLSFGGLWFHHASGARSRMVTLYHPPRWLHTVPSTLVLDRDKGRSIACSREVSLVVLL